MCRRLCLSIFLLLNSTVLWAACDDGTDVCLELQVPVDADEVGNTPVSNVTANQLDVSLATSELIDSITNDLKARRLTKPPGNNALQKIQRLRTIDPEHDYSINGERYVARIYLSMARYDLKNNRIERARARLDAATGTYPSLPGLQAVVEQLNAATTGVSAAKTADKKTHSDVSLIKNTGADSSVLPGSQSLAADGSTSAAPGSDAVRIANKQTAGAVIVPVMVGLPAGTFVMGSESGNNNEKPAHQAQVGAFSMSRYEITREQYNAFRADSGLEVVDAAPGQALLPVSSITLNEAIAYTRWLSNKTGKRYRLPTEVEWEYAARAGTMSPYHSGDTIFGVANCLTCLDQIPRSAMPVGSFGPNNFGLYDMHGNIAELTSSCFTDNYFNGSERTEQSCTKRVVRGGSWRSTREQVRSSFRLGQLASGRSMDTGIRVVHDGL